MRFTIALGLIVAFLIAISATTAIFAIRQPSAFFAAVAVLSVASAVLLSLKKNLGRHVLLLTSSLIACWWLYTIAAIIRDAWPHMDPLSAAISLVPGLLLIAFCVFAPLYVYRLSKKSQA
jgi:hypothetical protein